MKKFTFLGLVLLLFFGLSSANTNTHSPEYKAPILKTALNFSATYDDGMVKTSRTSIDTITHNNMKRYKVIKSKTNKSPVYPEDKYIMAISDRSYTFFTETNPEVGTWYYRVCAIMEDMNRYCSNVVELTISDTAATTTTITSTSTVTKNMKTIIDGLVTTFMKKIENKYPNNTSEQLTFLESFISRIGSLTTGKYGYLFVYLRDTLEEQIAILKLKNTLDL